MVECCKSPPPACVQACYEIRQGCSAITPGSDCTCNPATPKGRRCYLHCSVRHVVLQHQVASCSSIFGMIGETRSVEVELRKGDAANDGTPWPKTGPGQLQTQKQVSVGKGELWVWGGATSTCQTQPPGDHLVIHIWDAEEVLFRVTETRSGWRQASKSEFVGDVRIVPAFGMDGDMNLPLAKDGRVVGMISLSVSISSAGGRNDEDEFSETLVDQISPIFHPDMDGSSKRQARLAANGTFTPTEPITHRAEVIQQKIQPKTVLKQSTDFFNDSHSGEAPHPLPGRASDPVIHSPIPHPDETTDNQASPNTGGGWGPGAMLGGGSSTKAPQNSSAPMRSTPATSSAPKASAPQTSIGPGQGWGPGSMSAQTSAVGAKSAPTAPLASSAPNSSNAPAAGAWGPGSMLGGTKPVESAQEAAPKPLAAKATSAPTAQLGGHQSTNPPKGSWGPGSMFNSSDAPNISTPEVSKAGAPTQEVPKSSVPKSSF